MASDISTELRKYVIERANVRCEYCLIPQTASPHKHEPDHIVPRQHGGETNETNLALACMRCNRFKDPNIGSFDPENGNLVPFFNPRIHLWREHFEMTNAQIIPLTAEARVTVKILRFNDSNRIAEREQLIAVGLYLL